MQTISAEIMNGPREKALGIQGLKNEILYQSSQTAFMPDVGTVAFASQYHESGAFDRGSDVFRMAEPDDVVFTGQYQGARAYSAKLFFRYVMSEAVNRFGSGTPRKNEIPRGGILA